MPETEYLEALCLNCGVTVEPNDDGKISCLDDDPTIPPEAVCLECAEKHNWMPDVVWL
jgi:hypothetical protein